MLIIFFLRIKIDVTQFLINTASLKKEKKKEITKAHLRENKITYLSRFPFPLQKLQLAWLQKRPLRLFSNSLHFARKYGNVTDIRFLLLPRPVTSQHDFRHRFASRFTVRSHANRFLTSLRAPWVELISIDRSRVSDSNPMFLEFHDYVCAMKMDGIVQIYVCCRWEKQRKRKRFHTIF